MTDEEFRQEAKRLGYSKWATIQVESALRRAFNAACEECAKACDSRVAQWHKGLGASALRAEDEAFSCANAARGKKVKELP